MMNVIKLVRCGLVGSLAITCAACTSGVQMPYGDVASERNSFGRGAPQTIGAQATGYTYVPIDPLSVISVPGQNCEWSINYMDTLTALPDNAVRIAVTDISAGASGSAVLGSVGLSGRRYRVTIDYINADTTNVRFRMARFVNTDGTEYPVGLFDRNAQEGARLRMARISASSSADDQFGNAEEVAIPVYVGVGIRITANVYVTSGEVQLSGLGPLAAAAQFGQVQGDLVIQTLGISGQKVATALPLPSELNPTTIQNAIMAMAVIKSAIYSGDGEVNITPRVVGFYDPLPFGGADYANAVVSQLGREAVEWPRPCVRSEESS